MTKQFFSNSPWKFVSRKKLGGLRGFSRRLEGVFLKKSVKMRKNCQNLTFLGRKLAVRGSYDKNIFFSNSTQNFEYFKKNLGKLFFNHRAPPPTNFLFFSEPENNISQLAAKTGTHTIVFVEISTTHTHTPRPSGVGCVRACGGSG